MPILIDRIDEDAARDNNSVIYTLILKSGATDNEINFFNKVAGKQTSKQFNSIHATRGQIKVQVTDVSFPDMTKKVEELLASVNGPDGELTEQIREYNQKLKQQK
jgi:hypothetical protein